MKPGAGESPHDPAPFDARPRQAKGLIAPMLRVMFVWPYRAVLWLLLALGAKPDHLTIASLALNAGAAAFLARGDRALPGVLFLLAGILDVFDGAVARERGIASVRGAWLDSVIDRISDALVLGALFVSLVWQGRRTDAALALVALAVSLLVSYVRAEAEARGARMSEGAFARPERVIVLFVGLCVPRGLSLALGALAVLGGYTLLQRMWVARGAIERVRRD